MASAAEAIHNLGLPSRIVMLTVHADEDYLFQTLRLGASGYVLKSSADNELIDAIRTAHRGEVFLYPSAVKKLLTEYLKGGGHPGEEHDSLTNREREVLKLTAEGYTNNEIGATGHQPKDGGYLPPADHGEAQPAPPLRARAIRAQKGSPRRPGVVCGPNSGRGDVGLNLTAIQPIT
jgi:hypothetical protein